MSGGGSDREGLGEGENEGWEEVWGGGVEMGNWRRRGG